MTKFLKVFEIFFLINLIWANQDHQNHNKQSNIIRRPVYKLTYFNARLRGEFIRWIFAIANQTFQDVRIEDKDWPRLKTSFPFQQLPVLDISDRTENLTLSQSGAIARLLAGRFNMTGKNDIEAAYAHMYSDQLTDFFDEFGRASAESDTSILNTFLNQTLPRNMKFFEDRLARNRGFLAGTSLSYADVHLSSILDLMSDQKNMILKVYPNIAALDKKVLQIPQIVDWIKRRPKTDL